MPRIVQEQISVKWYIGVCRLLFTLHKEFQRYWKYWQAQLSYSLGMSPDCSVGTSILERSRVLDQIDDDVYELHRWVRQSIRRRYRVDSTLFLLCYSNLLDRAAVSLCKIQILGPRYHHVWKSHRKRVDSEWHSQKYVKYFLIDAISYWSCCSFSGACKIQFPFSWLHVCSYDPLRGSSSVRQHLGLLLSICRHGMFECVVNTTT